MSIYQAVILGAVQGLTEILPISSSGHLILVPRILGWESHSLSFDAALHLGTALALLALFGKDWINLIAARSYRLIAAIFLASIPVGLVGLGGGEFIEDHLRDPGVAAAALVSVAGLMLLGEWFYRRRRRRRDQLGIGDALAIGCSQVLALVPGVSRSGITILTGIGRGLNREQAVRFSFLISLPIVFAAGLWELLKVYREGMLVGEAANFAVGIGTAFVFGLAAVSLLFRILKRFSLIPFAIYRILLGMLLLLAL